MFACESLVFMTLMEFTIAQVQFRTVEIFRDKKNTLVSYAPTAIREKHFQKSSFQIETNSTRRREKR